MDKPATPTDLAIFTISNAEAHRWAIKEQGFTGDYQDWIGLSDVERQEYEDGANGVPTL